MNKLQNDPKLMEMIINNDPYLKDLFENNPMARNMINNPDLLRNQINMTDKNILAQELSNEINSIKQVEQNNDKDNFNMPGKIKNIYDNNNLNNNINAQ
jgi:hypothetical protein